MNTNTVTKRAIFGLIAIMLISTLAACATINKQDCLQGNWQATGFKDGTAGRTTDRFPLHVKACAKHGVTANEPRYLTGYQAGVENYCQPQNGIKQGIQYHDYRGICPAELESAFLQQYLLGLQQARRQVLREHQHYDHKLHSARLRHPRLTAGEKKDDNSRRIYRLRNKLDSLKTDQFSIDRKINRWRRRV